MPGVRAGPSWRVVSPSGGSILMTSAPRSPSCWAAQGPKTTVVQSRILTPASGPAIERNLPLPSFPTTTSRPWVCRNHDTVGALAPPKRPETFAGRYSFPRQLIEGGRNVEPRAWVLDGAQLAETADGRRRRHGRTRCDECRPSPRSSLEEVARLLCAVLRHGSVLLLCGAAGGLRTAAGVFVSAGVFVFISGADGLCAGLSDLLRSGAGCELQFQPALALTGSQLGHSRYPNIL